MQSHYLRNSLIASALACAFAAAPALASADVQPSPAMQSETAQAEMHQADNQTVPGKVDDGWITTKVKSKLATTKDLKSTDISVETTEGVVTLTGTVASASAKSRAVREARAIKGVKSVNAGGLTVSGG